MSGFKSQKNGYIRQHDTILYYSKSNKFIFNKEYLPYSKEYIEKMFKHKDERGVRYRLRGDKKYFENERGIPVGTNWTDIHSLQTITQAKEITGYPTQKPLKLLERIIRASTNKGDIVLDPFCGCATTCVAAETLERQWIGIDVSPKAYELVKERLNNPVRMTNFENGDSWQFEGEIIQRTDIPVRTDIAASKPIPYKTMRRKLYRDQGGKCNLCGVNFDEWNLEIDHIHPRSKGGIDNIENRQLLCGHCNRIKSNKTQAEAKAAINKFLKSR